MKHIHYYIGALAFLIACSSEERITTDSNEKPSGPIVLSAGIVEGSSKATTRTEPTSYQALTKNTKLALQVSGSWTGHVPDPVIQTTTATIGTVTDTSNPVSFNSSETLYWDDYGTADANNTTGREKGLTIYGAAVNGKSLENAGLGALLNTETNWEALSWTLPTDQRPTGYQPADKDLLISNNVRAETDDGTYKFDLRNNGKLLKFKHAMSKITVNLKAGAGFTGSGFTDTTPVVHLTGNEGDPLDASAWTYTTGTVDITTGGITESGQKFITMSQATTAYAGYDITKEALVMPGSLFKKPTGTAPNLVYPVIVRIKVDGNIYYVTSEKIRKAIDESNFDKPSSTDFKTLAGKNYVINITVNETGISVTATVANWTDISADNVAPVINLVGQLGGSASDWGADKQFSFYRSESLNTGYSSTTGDYYPEESVLSYTHSSHTWALNPVLYWPNHNTHYQFRAVWPQTVTTNDGTKPCVEEVTHSATKYQVIKVNNVPYSQGSFPSDLMIARPNVQDLNGNCGSRESDEVHPKKNLYTEGICARTGAINLTFNYMMSKVKVNLSTSIEGDPDYPATVNLNNAKVEIINVYNNGDVRLGDRTVNCENYSPSSYTLHTTDAIVPQTFAYNTTPLADGNTKIRITIYTNGDPNNGIDDIYEADFKKIPVKLSDSSDEPAEVNGWESGKSYVYNLRLTKTKVQVTAELTDWTSVEATQNIWF